jgi:putative transposase
MNKVTEVRAGDRAVTRGTRWQIDGTTMTVVAVTGIDQVIVEDAAGTRRSVRAGELRAADTDDAAPSRRFDPSAIATEDWERARQLQADLEQVGGQSELARSAIGSLSVKWGVSRATVWRRIQRFRREQSLAALIDRRPGPSRGAVYLRSDVESVIEEVARRWWHQTENATVTEIEPSVQSECRARGLPPPSRATIVRRLRVLRKNPDNFVGEARTALRERVRLMRGSYEVAQALGVVQIDHTVADVFLVDPASRAPIGRPTLTVAIDVATRCVLGICLSLEAPSALLVALCLEHAVFPKDAGLRALGATVDWPMYGRMSALHSDNGREFHSSAFRRGCDLNRIEVIYRPPATPRFGGHVERLIGTLMRRVRLLPGNSYSDALRRRPRRAEAKAMLTMADLQWYLTEEIARYHHSTHRGLGVAPRSAWERAWTREQGIELPPLPGDRMKFLRDFLPAQRRVVGREGIEFAGLKYSHPSLASQVDPGRLRVIRFDPRDLSRVYLEQPDGRYLTVPLRDGRFPALSLWEWRAIRRLDRAAAARADGDRIARILEQPEQATPALATPLRRHRRRTRRAEWQAIQALHALPVTDVSLSPTLTSPADSPDLAWEVLE